MNKLNTNSLNGLINISCDTLNTSLISNDELNTLENSWQPYDTVSRTAALDSYILNTVEQAPDLILLIPKADRKLTHRVIIDKTYYYVFEFLKHQFKIPVSATNILKDRTSLRSQALSLPLLK